MEQSFKDMGQRYINATDSFIECIQGIAKCTQVEAEKVLKIYQKEKLVKLGWNDGQFRMKHGGFMDAKVIRRAIEL
jgi:hypothetical protein